MASNQVVVTTRVEGGPSVFKKDYEASVEIFPGGGIITKFFAVSEVPVNVDQATGTVSKEGLEGVTNATGVNFLSCEMPPGSKSPMHGTPSIDFGVMITGEITLVLDSGEERVLRPGDVYVQKGTPHAWENRGTVPAKFATVLVAGR